VTTPPSSSCAAQLAASQHHRVKPSTNCTESANLTYHTHTALLALAGSDLASSEFDCAPRRQNRAHATTTRTASDIRGPEEHYRSAREERYQPVDQATSKVRKVAPESIRSAHCVLPPVVPTTPRSATFQYWLSRNRSGRGIRSKLRRQVVLRSARGAWKGLWGSYLRPRKDAVTSGALFGPTRIVIVLREIPIVSSILHPRQREPHLSSKSRQSSFTKT